MPDIVEQPELEYGITSDHFGNKMQMRNGLNSTLSSADLQRVSNNEGAGLGQLQGHYI